MDLSSIDLGPVVNSLSLLTDPKVLGLVLLGNVIGLVFGVLPGISGGQAFVILLPLTFGWAPEVALWFLMGMLGATSFGGAMCAILINVPGDTQNAATCFDGYPMTRRGEATRALGIAAMANILGTTFGTIVLVLSFPIMQAIVLAFGPPEFFWLSLMGLIMIAIAARGSFLKGLIGGGVGIMLGIIGFSPVLGVGRYTGGRDYLFDGVQLIALFIGLFAIAQAIDFSVPSKDSTPSSGKFSSWSLLLVGFRDVLARPGTMLRTALIGTFAGMIPGIGATAASFISYAVAKQFSKHKKLFHHGNPEGIIASEGAVNAKEPGGLLPMLAFGIPGSIEAALVLAALIFHGAQPGPFLIRDNPGVVWAIVMSLWVSNIFGTLLGISVCNFLARLTQIPVVYMSPLILVLSLTGTYLWRQNLWDVFVAIAAGIFGYFFTKAGFSVVTLIIGFLLGEIAEKAYFQSMQISNGSYAVFFARPSSLVIVAIVALTVVFMLVRHARLRSTVRGQAAPA
ncbi:MAG TPA: tripartite tricarboxylate transporter permease [Chloroflexota bacterium]